MVVAVKDGGGGVAGDVDVGPAVLVVVEGGDGEAVVAVGALEAAGFADVFELTGSSASAAEIVIDHVGRAGKAARTAHDGDAFPHATGASAGLGSCREIEVDVVGDDEIEFAVAVVVDEGAAGAPLFAGACDSGLLGYFFEGAVALVVEEAVLAVAGDVEVVEAVVVVVADAGSLTPAGGG